MMCVFTNNNNMCMHSCVLHYAMCLRSLCIMHCIALHGIGYTIPYPVGTHAWYHRLCASLTAYYLQQMLALCTCRGLGVGAARAHRQIERKNRRKEEDKMEVVSHGGGIEGTSCDAHHDVMWAHDARAVPLCKVPPPSRPSPWGGSSRSLSASGCLWGLRPVPNRRKGDPTKRGLWKGVPRWPSYSGYCTLYIYARA